MHTPPRAACTRGRSAPTPSWPCVGRALGSRCAAHPPLRRRQEDRGVHARVRARLRRRLPRGRRAELTRTPRRLRCVRTCYPYALGAYRRRRAACPQGPAYCTYWVHVPASAVPYVPRTVATQVSGDFANPNPIPNPNPNSNPHPHPNRRSPATSRSSGPRRSRRATTVRSRGVVARSAR